MTKAESQLPRFTQHPSETLAEFNVRRGVEMPAREVRTVVIQPRKAGVGASEWTLGLGGPALIILGIALIASASSSYGSTGATQAAFGSGLLGLGIVFCLVLITIHAAVSVWRRNRD